MVTHVDVVGLVGVALRDAMAGVAQWEGEGAAAAVDEQLGEGGGFVWVRPFEEELQTTDVGHVFELRDQYHTPMVSIRLRAGQAAEEL